MEEKRQEVFYYKLEDRMWRNTEEIFFPLIIACICKYLLLRTHCVPVTTLGIIENWETELVFSEGTLPMLTLLIKELSMSNEIKIDNVTSFDICCIL